MKHSSRKSHPSVSLQLPPRSVSRESFLPIDTLVTRTGLTRERLTEMFETGTVEGACIDGIWYAQESTVPHRKRNSSGGSSGGTVYPRAAKSHNS